MPELPEVETVRQTLKTLVNGKTIVDVHVYWSNCVITKNFEKDLIGQTIHDILRYGKYLVFVLDRHVMVSHLRMEGKYYLHQKRAPSNHEHVVFDLHTNESLTYHDTRKFGKFELIDKNTYLKVPPLSVLGKEPKDMDPIALYKRLKQKRIPVKMALLDQHLIAGLGNIYVDETLFRAGIHPEKKCYRLTKKDVNHIVYHAINVLSYAIELGGSTIRTYHAMHGVDGKFQNELKVHTKKDMPCEVCHTPIIKIKVGGRGTYVCPTCQRK